MTAERHFTHFDDAGQARMVDVADKAITRRLARAGGRIAMQPQTLALIRDGKAGKGKILVATDVTDNYIVFVGGDADKFASNEKTIDEIWGSFGMYSGGYSGNS